jgi:hypothetical protein
MKEIKSDINIFKDDFLKGKISNIQISIKTTLSVTAVSYHTTKWIKEYTKEKKDEMDRVPDIDVGKFNYIESIKEHSKMKSSITIIDCKNMSNRNIKDIVDKIETPFNKKLNKPSLL